MDPACQVGTVQRHGGSFMIWGIFSWYCLGSLVRVPTSLNAIGYVELLGDYLHSFCSVIRTDVLEQGMKGYHTAPMNHTELWTAFANIWQVFPVERFQKLVECIPYCVAAVIKVIGGPTRYWVGIPNSVTLQCNILSLVLSEMLIFILINCLKCDSCYLALGGLTMTRMNTD
ncbi:transposable element Tcb2 transposase [Trichonephila clavipes]|uniref:Transposable element Tcb2 transposase n=1 Tax=Trichonephila clavipes TaxID=2585209 RepID=A0A8X7BK27_TRICX|nr:transposable element Tcb2 transposase [Trichonephila clavipes]